MKERKSSNGSGRYPLMPQSQGTAYSRKNSNQSKGSIGIPRRPPSNSSKNSGKGKRIANKKSQNLNFLAAASSADGSDLAFEETDNDYLEMMKARIKGGLPQKKGGLKAKISNNDQTSDADAIMESAAHLTSL